MNLPFKQLTLLSVFMLILIQGVTAQVIFSETFDEPEESTDGTDNVGGVFWETDCPSCLDGSDYFKIDGGKLEGQDSNGPATWTTDPIDVSDCDFIEISFDLSEEGDMESCGTGCNSVDWVMFEYNVDGAGWTTPADAYFCGGTCAGIMVIQSDDIPGGSLVYNTGCMDGGSEIEVRITIQTWAASERWQIDNFIVECSEGPEVGAGEDLVICEGSEVALTADNPDDADLSWDHDVTDGDPFTPDLGLEDYVVSASDGVCTATDTVLVDVVPITDVVVTPAGPFTVASGIQVLDASPVDGIWSADCGACIDALTGEFDPAVAGVGDWEICYVAGVAPCDDIECITVTVTEICELPATITSTDPTCFGDTNGSVSIEVEGTTGLVTYLITNELGDPVNVDNEPFANDLPEGWYYFNVEDEIPCYVIDSVYINAPEAIEIELTVENPMCAGDGGMVAVDTVLHYVGTYADLFYSWSPLGVEGVGMDVQDDLTDGLYLLTVEDGNGCTGEVDFDITSPALLTITSVELTDLNCYDVENGEIEVTVTGGTPAYAYRIDGGTFTPDPVFDGLGAGIYEITIRDDNDCEVDTIVELLSPSAFIVTTEITDETCAGNCDGIIDLNADGGVSPYNFSVDGCVTTFDTGLFTGLCTGDFTICVTDDNGCSYTEVVTVEEGLPVLDGTINVPTLICDNDSPFPIDVENLGTLSGTGVVDGVFFPAVAGAGNHTITNTFDGTCSLEYTAVFTVNPAPNVDFTVDEIVGCAPLTVTFLNTGDAGAIYQWNAGDGASFGGGSTVTHTYVDPGLYSPTLTVTATNGCVNYMAYDDLIYVEEQPKAGFTYHPNPINTLETIVNFTDQSFDATTWSWAFGDLGNSNLQNPEFVFPELAGSHDVELVVENLAGCSDTVIKTIVINEAYSVYIPNAFTPDGDQLNATFKPWFNGIDIYNYSLTIYNRWGENIFVSYSPAHGWDGTYDGELVENGVYIYHIVISEISTDKKIEYQGHVTLLR